METNQQEGMAATIEQAVTALFLANPVPNLLYHNLTHTKTVVRHAMGIASFYNLSEKEHLILLAAAWFHDTGHLFTMPDRHEEESEHAANAFFNVYPGVAPVIITAIGQCIMATKMPQKPLTLTEKILCDADLFHLGTNDFFRINELLRRETVLRAGKADDWQVQTLRMLQEHTFHTRFCREKLNAGKRRNMIDILSLRKTGESVYL